MPEIIKNWLYNKNPFNYQGGLFGPRPEGTVYGKKVTERKGYNQRKALQLMYLGIEDKNIPVDEFVIESKYKPSINDRGNTTYYTFVGLDDPETKLKKFALYGGGARRNRNTGKSNYSHMTISKGRDLSGDYYGLYDTWNFDSYKPILKINQIFNTDIERKVGFNPIELYDRIYLDDYYNIPEDKRGGNYLDELVVTPTNAKFVHNLTKEKQGGTMNYMDYFKNGSGIHIKKKNRGKFTKSAKAVGEGVQEHAHKVMNDPNATPLQRKRANFAIQAKKWHFKHQDGGIMNYLNYCK